VHKKQASLRYRCAEVESATGICYAERKSERRKNMAQDTAKKTGKRTRAVNEKRGIILAAARETFSLYGIHGTRVEQVAERAGVSKTNLLYYFASKEALYLAVLQEILDVWLAPLKAFREDLAPLVAIREYIRSKLEVSRDNPQASRLFCLEMLQGAPVLNAELSGALKALVEEKSAIIAGWVASGKLAPVDPHHLIFMIWASTQHYADFASQVEAVTGKTLQDEAFFNSTVENVQRMIIEGIRPH
jgi:TetR/AcrR family transcriptional regulator